MPGPVRALGCGRVVRREPVARLVAGGGSAAVMARSPLLWLALLPRHGLPDALAPPARWLVNLGVRARVSPTMGDAATTRPRVRVGVVDGYPLAREGLKAFLAAAPGIEVVGEAADGEEAVRLVGAAAPELVVLGFDLARGPNGVAVCRSLKALPEPPRVLVLAGHNFAEAMLPFLLAGADSYLHRARDRGVIVDAAWRTATGERVWDGAERLGEAAPIVRAGPRAVGLTRRELEVLTLKHHRLTNADIAAQLSISRHTVKHHVSSIRSKLANLGAATPAARRRR